MTLLRRESVIEDSSVEAECSPGKKASLTLCWTGLLQSWRDVFKAAHSYGLMALYHSIGQNMGSAKPASDLKNLQASQRPACLQEANQLSW